MSWGANRNQEELGELSIGTLLAVRGFALTYVGGRRLLQGASVDRNHEPGITTAVCHIHASAAAMSHLASTVFSTKYGIVHHTGKSAGKSLAEKDHRAPVLNCTCGIHACKWESRNHHQGEVFGVVRLSGRVIEGTLGYRAERSEVIALYTTNTELAAHYDAWMITRNPDQFSSIDELLLYGGLVDPTRHANRHQ